MTKVEVTNKLLEIEHSSNPEMLCQDLNDQTLLLLMQTEQHYPRCLPRHATEEYQRRMKSRNQMYREVPPPYIDWTADPQ